MLRSQFLNTRARWSPMLDAAMFHGWTARGASGIIKRRCAQDIPRRTATTEPAATQGQDSNHEVSQTRIKGLSEMPGKKGLPLLGCTMEHVKYIHKLHLLQMERFNEFGRLWKENTANFGTMVFLVSIEGVQDLARCEGKYPRREKFPAWVDYYETHKVPKGILMENDEEWHKIRKTVDKPIMRPNLIGRHVPALRQVSRDFVTRLGSVKAENGDVANIDQELFKWALESGCSTLYERRLGLLSPSPPRYALDFIEAVRGLSTLSSELMLYPQPVVKTFMASKWKKMCHHFDLMIQTGKVAVEKQMASPDVKNTLIGYILSCDTLETGRIVSTLMELMMASVDTTTHTVHALLWELGRRPEIQAKMREEIRTQVTANLTYGDLEKLPYTNGVIKEILRLYPVGFVLSRVLEDDSVIQGYRIPKKTSVLVPLYPFGRDPELYPDPEEINPERWIRSDKGHKPAPFSFVPFGVGVRSCIGKRMAMTGMQLFCFELLQRFQVTTTTPEIELVTKSTLGVDKPVHICLTEV